MKGFIYAKEEVYFATLAQDLTSNHLEHNYCYIDWLNGLNITQNDVDLVLNNDFTLLKSIKQYNYTLNFFNFFAVKRIHRDINDPIRRYITKLQK